MIDKLLEKMVASLKVPIVSAGSIDSFQKIQQTINHCIWGFTIGGAFFDKKFKPKGSFRDNVKAVVDYLKGK